MLLIAVITGITLAAIFSIVTFIAHIQDHKDANKYKGNKHDILSSKERISKAHGKAPVKENLSLKGYGGSSTSGSAFIDLIKMVNQDTSESSGHKVDGGVWCWDTNDRGHSGIVGFSGHSGIVGFSGHSGIVGFSGHSGIVGFSGHSGIVGCSGISGHSGLDRSKRPKPTPTPSIGRHFTC